MFKAIMIAIAALAFSSSAMAQDHRHDRHRDHRVERHYDHDRYDRHGHKYKHRDRHDDWRYDRHDRRHMKKIVKRVCDYNGCRTIVKYVRR